MAYITVGRPIAAKAVELSYTGIIQTVKKDDATGYALLYTDGELTFTGAVPDTVDIYMVGAGCAGTLGVGGDGGNILKLIGVKLPRTSSAVVAQVNDTTAHVESSIHTWSTSAGTCARGGTVSPSTGAQANPATDFWGMSWGGSGGNSQDKLDGGYGSGGAGYNMQTAASGAGGPGSGGAGGGSMGTPGAAGYFGKAGGDFSDDVSGDQITTHFPTTHGGGSKFTGLGGGAANLGREGGGGWGGGGGAASRLRDSSGNPARGGQGGAGVIIIRWGDSPL